MNGWCGKYGWWRNVMPIPIDEWEKALEFKDKACREYARTGLSSVTRKYLKDK